MHHLFEIYSLRFQGVTGKMEIWLLVLKTGKNGGMDNTIGHSEESWMSVMAIQNFGL
jgi:hypothetical protein